MTRLQKSALTELTAPAAVALVFLALCYFGSGLPLKKAIDYSNIAFMGLSILLRSRLRGEDGAVRRAAAHLRKDSVFHGRPPYAF